MQTKYTKQFMIDNCGCYSSEQLQSCSFMNTGNEEITATDILNSEIPFKDKVWFFVNKIFNKEQKQQYAIICAKSVLHIYEDKYPEDLRPRKAIEKAELYLKGGRSLEELRQAYTAAYTAADDDDTAYNAATAAAADNAYNATAAAAAAACAAHAAHAAYNAAAADNAYAAHAAYAATYADYAANTAAYNAVTPVTDLLQILKDFIYAN